MVIQKTKAKDFKWLRQTDEFVNSHKGIGDKKVVEDFREGVIGGSQF